MPNPDDFDEMPEDGFSAGDIETLEEDFDTDLGDEDFSDDPLANSLDSDDDGDSYDENSSDDEEDAKPTPVVARSSNMADDDDNEAEDIDPDNVEADLGTILQDRLAASEDEDEDEDEVPEPSVEAAGQVKPKKDNEWTCQGCFFIVSSAQFGSRDNPRCPSGEDPCPSLELL